MHCVSEREAHQVLAALTDRMAEVGLQLHPAKTRIVYCRDGNRRGSHEHTSFTFLGYTFCARRSRNRHGRQFLSFNPAVSKDALKKMGREVRSWHLHTRSDLSFNELARRINPVVAGWLNYYGHFRPWELRSLVTRINTYLVRWIRQKYKRLAGKRKAIAKMQEIAQRYPRMFAHWRLTTDAVLA
ncbi:group II intron maturase-specific domain-containing protein [Streptomyces sp. ISL-86]|uniref:group II intron maturase-specific domain-containing protein n=1 Tax=Streptomyces sp. ISL-86 TaxID=2819187 RepID=UPI0027E4AF83|nr:group II intron maturase-specific domain-containing protein [Streptomyces sp. ISL-86]